MVSKKYAFRMGLPIFCLISCKDGLVFKRNLSKIQVKCLGEKQSIKIFVGLYSFFLYRDAHKPAVHNFRLECSCLPRSFYYELKFFKYLKIDIWFLYVEIFYFLWMHFWYVIICKTKFTLENIYSLCYLLLINGSSLTKSMNNKIIQSNVF